MAKEKTAASSASTPTTSTSASTTTRDTTDPDSLYASDGWPVFAVEDGERLSRLQWLERHPEYKAEPDQSEADAVAAAMEATRTAGPTATPS